MDTAQAIIILRLQIAILERVIFTSESFTRADERDHQFLIHDAKQMVARLTSLPPDACGGQTVDDEKRAVAGAGEDNR